MLQIRCEYPQEQIVTGLLVHERGGLIDSAINKPKTQSNSVVDIFHFTKLVMIFLFSLARSYFSRIRSSNNK